MEMESYNDWGKPGSSNGNTGYSNGVQDRRSYSANYATSAEIPYQPPNMEMPRELNKKGKRANGSISSKAGWCFSDPELQRKKRVASYKAYTVEGKIKRSFSRSFRWLKDRYTHMVHGW